MSRKRCSQRIWITNPGPTKAKTPAGMLALPNFDAILPYSYYTCLVLFC
jgi:hypothetical protein